MAQKIIVAEDDKFLAKAYKSKLSKAGFDVIVVGDGSEFFQKVAEFQPDLAILDLVMPKMDGFAVLQKIKTDNNLKSIPVIVASNLGQSEDIKKAKKLGADDYLIKSDLSMKALIEKIKKLAKAA